MKKTFSIKPRGDEKSGSISCPVCGSGRFRHHWECGDFRFSRCRKCRLILQNPQPLFEALDKRYDEDYFHYEQENGAIFFELMLKGLADVGFPGTFPRGAKNMSFLDIGCATGLLVEHMQKSGWSSRGVELCGPAAEFGSRTRNIEIYSGTVEQACYEAGSFDVVHCSHLIEHLNDPAAFVAEVKRILRPGGYFICATPNSDSFQARFFGSRWRSAIADHMFLFSRRTLSALIRNKGLKVKKIRTWGGLGQGYGPVFLKKTMDRAAKKFGFGDVMIIVAEKER